VSFLLPEVFYDKAGYADAPSLSELFAHVLEKHIVVNPLVEAPASEKGSVSVFKDFLEKQSFELGGDRLYVPANLLPVTVRIGRKENLLHSTSSLAFRAPADFIA